LCYRGLSLVPASSSAFVRFAWFVLGYAILVIVWGAVVRATGSGAGCGAHWPLCNGEVVPLSPGVATTIEFTHRATSGVILILVTGLLVWARRAYPAGHPARRAAMWSMIFVLIEAAVGAGIVLLRLVEGNASALRAGYVAAHLVNTMLFVGALTATAFAARPPEMARAEAIASGREPWMRLGLASLLVVCAAGAIVALGDTLFPHASLAEGLAADADPTSHFLIRLRVWHPIFAAVASVYLVLIVSLGGALSDRAVRGSARLLLGLLAFQFGLGVINLLALAPLGLQLAHLAVSNLLWIALVWMWLVERQTLARQTPARA
jgi:heme a synthase